MDEKTYSHQLFSLLVYVNGCESKLIPLQIKILERIKLKKKLSNNEILALIKKIHPGDQDISEEGWMSRFYNLVSPLKQTGLIKSMRMEGKPTYTLSDGWMTLVNRDLINKPKD